MAPKSKSKTKIKSKPKTKSKPKIVPKTHHKKMFIGGVIVGVTLGAAAVAAIHKKQDAFQGFQIFDDMRFHMEIEKFVQRLTRDKLSCPNFL